jgi:two-component system sensor histidine kinase MtrB
LIPQSLPEVTRDALNASGLQDTFRNRGVDLVAAFGDEAPEFASLLSPEFEAAVDRGEIAFQWVSIGGRPSLVTGGRLPGSDATFYFVHDASAIESTLATLRAGLIVGTLVLIVIALVAARAVARGVLAPVEEASRAAERIERGDLSARVPVASADEFGDWAETFNRMAASLEETIGRLEAAQSHNRRFVADVSHELRTPLAALVAEASIVREDLDSMPAASRRAGELLVADVARLRTLVDDLMEISRFDAGAEQLATEPVDLVELVTTVATARLPGGHPGDAVEPRRRRVRPPPDRGGSSATSSTTRRSTPRARRSRSASSWDVTDPRRSSRSPIAARESRRIS